MVGAAEWVVVHTNPDGDRYFYDASKLAVSGNEITYWKKVTFRSAQSYKGNQAASAMYRERIHCTEHTLKPLNHVIHTASGTVIEWVTTESETAAIIPETVGDVFEQTLCRIVKFKRDTPPFKMSVPPPTKEATKALESPEKERERIEIPASPEKEKVETPASPYQNDEPPRPAGML